MLKQLTKLAVATVLATNALTAAATNPDRTVYPTIFIHGYLGEYISLFGGDSGEYGYWGNLPVNMQIRGLPANRTYYHRWSSGSEGVTDKETKSLALKINEALAAHKTDKVNLVAHSMGGLLVRDFFLNFRSYVGNIHSIVTIGTPHKGTYIAYAPDIINYLCNIMSAWSPMCSVTETKAYQMFPGSSLLTKLNDKKNTNNTGIGRSMSIASTNDEIVGPSSALGWVNSANQSEALTYTCTNLLTYLKPSVHMSQLDHIVTGQIVYDFIHNNKKWGLKKDDKALETACTEQKALPGKVRDEL